MLRRIVSKQNLFLTRTYKCTNTILYYKTIIIIKYEYKRVFYWSYAMYWLCLWFVVGLCSADELWFHDPRFDARRLRARRAVSTGRANFFNTTFPALNNHHKRGVAATEQQYPWIARVIHSRTEKMPHVCTASCIDKRIFVTAARCIFNLKVDYTTVHYQNQILRVRAFITPSKPTKQMFDDIGFIVLEDEPKLTRWPTIGVFDTVNRTDNEFMWLHNLGWHEGPQEHYVVGYAADDNTTKYQAPDTTYALTELKIVIDLELCNELTSMDDNDDATDFWVPCYHSCTVNDDPDDDRCKIYHGVEGGAVIDKKNKTLIGVATWGGYDEGGVYVLPVGFSVLNSDSFHEDRKCAVTVRDSATSGGYQSLCAR